MTSFDGGQADGRQTDTQDEATLRRIVEEFPAMCVSVTNSDGLVTSVWFGEHYARISGYELDELIANPEHWISLIHPADQERIREAYRLLSAGKPMHEEYRIFRRDGQMRSILETGTVGKTVDGTAAALRCVMDVSGTQAEFAISYRELVDEAPVGISVRDLSGQVLYCNQAYAMMFGYDTPEEMVGTSFRDILSPVTLEEFTANIFPRILEGAWSGEISVHRKDGAERILQLSANVFRGLQGNPLAAYALVLDISELRQTEKALRGSRELLEAVQNAIAANIAVVDADGNIVAVNERWRRFARENGDPLLAHTCEGVNYLEVCRRASGPSSEGAGEAHAGLLSVLRGETHEFEMEYPCPSPLADCWILMRASALAGESAGAVIIHVDITKRRKAEEAVKGSQELLLRRYDAISAGLLVLDLRGAVVHVNKAGCSILNMSPELLLGTTMEDPIWRAIREDGTPFEIDELPAIATLRTGQPTRGTRIGFFCGRPETCKWLLINCEPIFDPATGDLKEVMAAFLDITESKRTEEALRESEARYHSLLENLDAVVFRMGADMRLLAVAGRVESMLEYGREELLSSRSLWRDVVHPEDVNRAMRVMEIARKTRSPQWVEIRLVQRSGTIVWIRGTLTPIFDDKGEFVYFDGVSLDITERVEAQERDARRSARMRALTESSQQCASTLDSRQILDTVTEQVCKTLGCVAAGMSIEPVTGRLLNLSLCCPTGCDVRNLDREIREADLGVDKVFGAMDVSPRIVLDLCNSSPGLASFARRGGFEPGIIAPVTAGEELLGVLLAARQAGEEFDEEDLWFLTEVASHASAALANSILYRRQQRIAETLQRTLIPPEPAIGFLDIATLYAPAPGEARVGGDFFDVFKADGTKVGLVVGDVSGKGVEAAIHTAEAKYMLRAFAHEDPDPLSVVTKLNAALFDYLPVEAFITLVYFLIDVENHTMTYVNAGHEASIVLSRDKKRIYEIGPNGPMLGVTSMVAYSEGQASLGPDDLLFCYTDGVTDVRTNGDRFGFRRLRQTVASAPNDDARGLMDYVMKTLQGFGAAKQTDDQVVVVVRPLV